MLRESQLLSRVIQMLYLTSNLDLAVLSVLTTNFTTMPIKGRLSEATCIA